MWNKLVLCVGLIFGTTALGFDHNHGVWSGVLGKYLNANGFVDYNRLRQDSKSPTHPFKSYLKTLSAVPNKTFQGWNKAQKMSFLINAYNAFTVELILQNKGISSIKDIGSLLSKPWDKEFFSLLGGKIKSLDPIEHEFLRPVYKDYRIHAAVNCASVSCPVLRREAYVPSKLNAQLDQQMQVWLKDPSRTRFDLAKNTVYLSKIFDWYEDDFTKAGVLNVVAKYAPANVKAALQDKIKKKVEIEIEYLDYNWNLNDVKNDKNG